MNNSWWAWALLYFRRIDNRCEPRRMNSWWAWTLLYFRHIDNRCEPRMNNAFKRFVGEDHAACPIVFGDAMRIMGGTNWQGAETIDRKRIAWLLPGYLKHLRRGEVCSSRDWLAKFMQWCLDRFGDAMRKADGDTNWQELTRLGYLQLQRLVGRRQQLCLGS